jgi:hypothetical protein
MIISKIELIGEDKTKINATLLEKPEFSKSLIRIDVNVESGIVDFLRKNKVFYLKVLETTTFDKSLLGKDAWIRLKQRIKKCNRCERLNWNMITFIAKLLTNLDVLKELHKDDVKE